MTAVDRKADFAQRAEYSPDMVYRHQVAGWRYIPIHPFFEELPPHDPKNEEIYESGLVEAYWEANGDVVFINVSLDVSAKKSMKTHFARLRRLMTDQPAAAAQLKVLGNWPS